MTTDRQKRAVQYCEDWLHIKFNGDLNNYKEVFNFLSENLESAKDIALEASCDYYAEYGY